MHFLQAGNHLIAGLLFFTLSGCTANEHLGSGIFLNIWQRREYWGLLVLPTRMGLGNSRYSLHNLAGNADAFRRATQLQPKNGIPFNTQVLNKQGKKKEPLAC